MVSKVIHFVTCFELYEILQTFLLIIRQFIVVFFFNFCQNKQFQQIESCGYV